MSRRKGLFACLAAGLLIAVMGTLVGFTNPARAYDDEKKEKHPRMHAAMHELKEARKELKEADHDFGGHRVEAIKAIDHAIVQIEKALKFDKK